jgi:periplasmic protein TonB
MKETHHFLYLSLFISLLLHLSVFYTAFWNNRFLKIKNDHLKAMVAVQVVRQPVEKPIKKMIFDTPKPPQALKPLPLPPEKPKTKPKQPVKPKKIQKRVSKPAIKPKVIKPKLKPTLPPSNTPHAKRPADPKKVKPVFGVNRDSLAKAGKSETAVRVGNTLMQSQEKEYTPPEEVKTYVSVPVFELSTMPVYKTKVDPKYPPSLKKKEVEGEVLLSATIDETGKVVKVSVKRSDNGLFSKAAVAALKQCTFTPAKQNDTPVTTTIDIPIKFMLDE